MPKARCWLGLAPLSPRTALQTNPLSDLGGSMELAEPPLVGMMRLPRTMRHRLERGAMPSRKAVGSAPAYPLPCRTLTLLVPSPRTRLPGMGEEIWTHSATWCSWPRRGGPGGGTHRRGERNGARPAKSRAHMHHVVTTATLVCRYARGSHLQGHMERSSL